MNDPMEHATGIEKRELLAKAAGNDNPFDMKVFKRGAGTKENPNLIPSAFEARIVGCICKFFIFLKNKSLLNNFSKTTQAKKIKPMCNGCGCKRAHPNAVNVDIGSSWLKRPLSKLFLLYYLLLS